MTASMTTPESDTDTDDFALGEYDAAELADPLTSLLALDAARCFAQVALGALPAIVAQSTEQEQLIRQPGGQAWAAHCIAAQIWRAAEEVMRPMIRATVPMSYAMQVLSAAEATVRSEGRDWVMGVLNPLLEHPDPDAAQQAGRDDLGARASAVGLGVRAAAAEMAARAADPAG